MHETKACKMSRYIIANIRLPKFAIFIRVRNSHMHFSTFCSATEFMRRATIKPYRPYARVSFSFCVFPEDDLVLTKNFSEDEY